MVAGTRALHTFSVSSLLKVTSKQEVLYHTKLADIKGWQPLCSAEEEVVMLWLLIDLVMAVF